MKLDELFLDTLKDSPGSTARSCSRPQESERSANAADRIRFGKVEFRDGSDHFVRWRLAADVEILFWRVSSHHEEVRTCFDLAVAGAGGQQRDIASSDSHLLPPRSSQRQPGGAPREAEHFVCG